MTNNNMTPCLQQRPLSINFCRTPLPLSLPANRIQDLRFHRHQTCQLPPIPRRCMDIPRPLGLALHTQTLREATQGTAPPNHLCTVIVIPPIPITPTSHISGEMKPRLRLFQAMPLSSPVGLVQDAHVSTGDALYNLSGTPGFKCYFIRLEGSVGPAGIQEDTR